MLPGLSGHRILVVEDEVLIAMLLETALEDAGCVVVGPYSRLSEALAAAARDDFDAALLDVNLAGEKVFPVAELLAERKIPFLLLSGYGDKATPPEHADWPTHGKPFNTDELMLVLSQMVS
ncbi:MAG TPA: response regulator [Acetobacteraceae bacterium]|jgi:DNA-binding response OmpR family regulator